MSNRAIERRVASVSGSQANGKPVRVAGQAVSCQVEAPAALALIEGSNDLRNWSTATSRVDGSTALSSIADGTHVEVFERFEWVRPAVASDVSAVRQFDFRFNVYEEE